MLKNNLNKKVLSGILITVMIVLNFSFLLLPQKAEAVPVTVVASVWEKTKSDLVFFAKAAAKRTIIFMSQSIADWISSGFQGNPSFLNDPERFATNVADVAIGDFLYNNPAFSFLCKPFQLQLKLSLALQHRKFYQTVDCTLSGALQNGKDAYTNFANGDFIGGGGWNSFLTMVTDPNATPEGAFLVFDSQLSLIGQDKQGQVDKEQSLGSGSLTLRECTDTTYNISIDPVTGNTQKQFVSQGQPYVGSPFYKPPVTTKNTMDEESGSDNNTDTIEGTSVETVCKVKSPGSLIASRLFFGSTSGQRMTEMQIAIGDGLDIIAAASVDLLTELATEQLKSTMSSLTGNNKDQQYYDNEQTIKDLQAQQAVQNSYNNSSNGGNSTNNNPNNPNPSDPLSGTRTALKNQRNIETDYQYIQNNILNYLNIGSKSIRSTFTEAMSCNYQDSSDATTNTQRAKDIQTNVLDLITTTDIFKELNKNIIDSNTNVKEIDSRLNTLSASTQINDLGAPPFHTEGQASDVSLAESIYVQAYDIANRYPHYSTENCPITIPTFSEYLQSI
ncbi:MAG: hypothetical protein WCC74_01430 [Minisyncoccia bacterium]